MNRKTNIDAKNVCEKFLAERKLNKVYKLLKARMDIVTDKDMILNLFNHLEFEDYSEEANNEFISELIAMIDEIKGVFITHDIYEKEFTREGYKILKASNISNGIIVIEWK